MSGDDDGLVFIGPGGDGWGYSLALESIERYGLTWDGYHELLDGQERQCAICKRHHALVGMLVVDHDHDSDNVRALLCQSCNLGLGQFRDRPDLLDAARWYLMKHGCESTRALDDPATRTALAAFTETPEQRARRVADLPTRTVALDLVYHAPNDERPLIQVGTVFDCLGKRWQVTEASDDGRRLTCREVSYGRADLQPFRP